MRRMLPHAARHPERLLPYVRRAFRNGLLGIGVGNHVSFYRRVMAKDAAADPGAAIGSPDRESWLTIGELQFEYLLRHHLTPSSRLLEIGCGNLRGGWRFIDYLEPGNYVGLDISPEILLAAQSVVAERGLRHKLPYLYLVDDLRLRSLPDNYFDVAHAHSVFTHSPIEVIEECLDNIWRVLRPGGFFDFTYFAAASQPYVRHREDFYYRTDQLVSMARARGYRAEIMTDWDYSQSKLRLYEDGAGRPLVPNSR
jgi:ubiquinone/menaquinone biosynthesis C-methylase UbiE